MIPSPLSIALIVLTVLVVIVTAFGIDEYLRRRPYK